MRGYIFWNLFIPGISFSSHSGRIWWGTWARARAGWGRGGWYRSSICRIVPIVLPSCTSWWISVTMVGMGEVHCILLRWRIWFLLELSRRLQWTERSEVQRGNEFEGKNSYRKIGMFFSVEKNKTILCMEQVLRRTT